MTLPISTLEKYKCYIAQSLNKGNDLFVGSFVPQNTIVWGENVNSSTLFIPKLCWLEFEATYQMSLKSIAFYSAILLYDFYVIFVVLNNSISQ
jgi:hypothetical protein